MDLHCIISSGDLELYVLGLLPEKEAWQVDQLATLFPEIREEIDRISETLEVFGSSASAAPSPAVKDKLFAQLKTLKTEEEVSIAPASVSSQLTDESKDSPVVPIMPVRKVLKRRSWMLAASIATLVACFTSILYLSARNRQHRLQITSLKEKVNTINRNLVEQQRRNLASTHLLRMYESEEYRQLKLTPIPGKPPAEARVLWNTKNNMVYVAGVSLPQPPARKQYQLWAIVDGKPVDAGMLQGNRLELQQMKPFSKAEAFAITLENEGGSPTPTMQEMYVMGKTT